MGLKSDRWIREMALGYGMIEPFFEGQVSQGVISYGLSSYGYDIRVGRDFKVFTNVNTTVVDPKNFDPSSFVDFIDVEHIFIHPNSFALAMALERVKMPRNVLTQCIGKSTYARTGIIVNVTPAEPCFSDDTEIMTPSGWKLFQDIEVGDLVMGMADDGTSVWQPVEKKQVHEYDGVMHHYAGNSVDLLVTPNHKVFVQRRTNGYANRKGSENTPWKTMESYDVFGHHNFSMSREINWVGRIPDEFVTLGKKNYPIKPFLVFLGLWLGDGSAYVRDGGNYIIKLAALKDRKRLFFREILDQLGVNYHEEERGFRFHHKELCEYLIPYRHSKNKHIPREWLDLCPEYLEYLWFGLLNSDGNLTTKSYTTSSKQLADDVQYIAFLMGKSAIVRQLTTKDGTIKGNKVYGGNEIFIVRVVDGQRTPNVSPKRHKREYYCGQVYDVTVPNHLIFVRRNGKPVWSGNCWEGYLTLEISNTTPLPAKIYAGEGIAQLLFFEGDEPCEVSYADRKGKYQNQTGITLPKVN